MPVSLKQYDTTIARLDRVAKANPQAYRMRVGALAVLGYVYIFLVLAIALGLLAGLVALGIYGHFDVLVVKLGLVCVAVVILILKSLRVSFPKPDGVAITRADCPPLFDLVDTVSAKLHAPKLHHILVTGEFNASILQRPRLGILGWQVNYLVLGLPLMFALTPEQFESVVAHEFGHLSGNHSRFGGWIYRVRRTWQNILDQLARNRGKYQFVFRPFFEWYVPYFSAYSFVQARMDEYVADRCSAELVGAKTAGEALLSIALKAKLLGETHGRSLHHLATTQPEPPQAVMRSISSCLTASDTDRSSKNWLGQMLAAPSGIDDTHPSLHDQLSALGYPDPLSFTPHPLTVSAAEAYLSHGLPGIENSLDASWHAQSLPGWKRRFAAAQKQRITLAEIEAKLAREPLSVDDAWMRARCTLDMDGAQAALPFVRDTLAIEPAHAQANFLLGGALLDQGDREGEKYILKAIQADAKVALAGSQRLHTFWIGQNRPDIAAKYQDQVYSAHDELAAAQQERAAYKPGDPVLPHGLTEEQVAPLVAAIGREPTVTEAFLFRKALQHVADDQPMFVATIVSKDGLFTFSSDGRAKRQALLRRVMAQPLQLPSRHWIRVIKARDPALQRIAATMPDSLIYRRAR